MSTLAETKAGFDLRGVKSDIVGSDSHIFWNFQIFNNDVTPILATFKENRDSPILDNASDFKVAIVRYTVPVTSVPLFDFSDYPGQGVTLRDLSSGTDFRTKVLYQSSSTPNVSGVIAPVYSYQMFVEMINLALLTSYTALKAANPGAPITQPPFLIYSPDTEIFSLYQQTAATDTAGTRTEIYFSYALAAFFGPNFPENFIHSYGGSVMDKDVYLPAYYTGDNIVTLTTGPTGRPNHVGGTLYKMSQEYSNIGLIGANGFRTLVITSNQLTIQPENTTSSERPGVPNSSRILTDMEPVIADATNARGYLQYQPNIYRFTDLLGSQPVSTLDLNLQWQDGAGDLFPVYLLPGQTITMKVLFLKRELAN